MKTKMELDKKGLTIQKEKKPNHFYFERQMTVVIFIKPGI